MAKILVVDDDKNNRITLSIILKNEGYHVEEAENGKVAIEKITKNHYDLVITDLKMEGVDGIDVLNHTKKVSNNTEVIVLTAYASINSAVKAMNIGAYDYIAKTGNQDETLLTVEKALERIRLKTEVISLKKIVREKYDDQNIIGCHPTMLEVFKLIKTVSNLDVPVLICGESGTGKELIARAIHYTSQRSDSSFVVINCGAMPENLQESELFGHVKGSFTGAFTNKIGLFREADGGTLMMDEVGEMSLSMQVKLLHVLQDGDIRPVGGNTSYHINTRLIFASNQDLIELTAKKKFREDLLFRINLISINIPSLKERKSDIPLLVEHFQKNAEKKFNKKNTSITSSALSLLMSYDWPGNVRELKNVIERAIILTKSNKISPRDINLDTLKGNKIDVNKQKFINSLTLKEIEKEVILERLERNHWNKGITASDLGVSTATLWRKINQFNLSS